LVSKDAFTLAEPSTSKAIYDAISAQFTDVIKILGEPTEIDVGSQETEEIGALPTWFDVFRLCQVRYQNYVT
jgi:hypothetical protein